MDPQNLDSVLKWVIITLFGGLMALLKWTAARLHKRVDDLERSKASIESLDRIETTFKEHRTETREGLKTLNDNVIKLLTRGRNHD